MTYFCQAAVSGHLHLRRRTGLKSIKWMEMKPEVLIKENERKCSVQELYYKPQVVINI